jgi:hypothetical protein
MKIEKRILTLLTIFILLLSTFAALSTNLIPKVNASDGAELTGNIIDGGKDTDADYKYNYLEVAIQINVTNEGSYRVEVPSLTYSQDSFNYTYYFWRFCYGYLTSGLQWLNVSFPGPLIYANKLNVNGIGEIRLYRDWYMIDSLYYVSFSQVYNYTDFDCAATLTGTIYDNGVDTDSDGLFNSLQIGVEINVTDPATYEVYVYALSGTVWVYVSNYSKEVFLNPGIQVVNVSLDGVKIYASHGNVSTVSVISLYFYDEEYYSYTIGEIHSRPLDKTYSYTEFDTYAFLTGKILDEGIDEDHDGLYDYLEVSVEVNVTDAGYYIITVDNLYGNNSDSVYFQISGIGQSFDVGVHLVNFTVYGPRIYAARIDPAYVGPVRLFYESSTWEDILLEQNPKMRLSVPYHYYEFESHAFLTGKVYDRGVDKDADGLFDYLEVGAEVNVTEAGTYQISVNGLAEKSDSYVDVWYDQYATFDLDLGVHIINFTFPGPMIAYYHINPTNVTGLSLMEYSTYYQLSYISTTALSTRYNYTQFNSPFNDMQVQFTVYPDATVGVSGSANYTRIYPPNYYGPSVNASLGFSTSGNLTTGSVNGTMMLPKYFREAPAIASISQEMRPIYPYPWYEFLYNSTTINFTSQYYNGMLNTQLNATMHLPPEGSTTYPFNSSNFSFHSTYSNGTLNVDLYGDTELPSFIASQFPFNVTDVTVLADYKNNEINGNITFHMLSGFPLGDVIVYFNGNKTEVSFTGHINVIYGNYFGMKINATVLEEMLTQINSTIPGQGENSLYNMTQGMVECTRLNTTMTPITVPLEGARVYYNATIHGNFTKLLSTVITQMLFGSWAPEETHSIVYAALDATLSSVDQGSLMLNYYYGSGIASLRLTLGVDVKVLWGNALLSIPPLLPPEYRNQTEALLKIANITAYAVENADMSVDYSSDAQQLNVSASLTANVTKLKNEIIQILPDVLPPQYRDFVESCTNTTYCTLDSLNTTCNYVNGVANFDAKWLLKGDFTAELNRMKHCYVDFLNLTSPWMINWQTQMLNETEIDISNFKAEFRQGEDWMTLTFQGLKIHPPKDEIDPVRFQLYRLFNMASSSYESPREFEKLKITITGEANATHTVLLYAPPTVPSPDNVSLDYRVMTWQNTKLSGLKDLVFQIAYQGVKDYLGNTYYIPIFTNSTVSNFNFDPDAKRISFNVTGTTGMGFCNITIPRSLLDVTVGNWTVKIDGIPLLPENFTVTQNDDYVFIYLTYSHSDHTIEIVGTWVVTEFPPNMLPPILVILSFIAAIIAVRKRRKLSILKTKYQSTINTLAKILHQLET